MELWDGEKTHGIMGWGGGHVTTTPCTYGAINPWNYGMGGHVTTTPWNYGMGKKPMELWDVGVM